MTGPHPDFVVDTTKKGDVTTFPRPMGVIDPARYDPDAPSGMVIGLVVMFALGFLCGGLVAFFAAVNSSHWMF